METKTYIVNVQGAIYHEGKYLCIRRSDAESFLPGEVGFPGGKLDENDEIAEDATLATLHREIMEEVNVTVTDCHLVTTSYFEADGVPVLNMVYLCCYHDGDPKAVDLDEVAEVMWLSLDDILTHPDTREWTHAYVTKADALRAERYG